MQFSAQGHAVTPYQENKPVYLNAIILDHFKAVLFRLNLWTEKRKYNDKFE